MRASIAPHALQTAYFLLAREGSEKGLLRHGIVDGRSLLLGELRLHEGLVTLAIGVPLTRDVALLVGRTDASLLRIGIHSPIGGVLSIKGVDVVPVDAKNARVHAR